MKVILSQIDNEVEITYGITNETLTTRQKLVMKIDIEAIVVGITMKTAQKSYTYTYRYNTNKIILI